MSKRSLINNATGGPDINRALAAGHDGARGKAIGERRDLRAPDPPDRQHRFLPAGAGDVRRRQPAPQAAGSRGRHRPGVRSSVIVGPAAESNRPFAAVKSITYLPASDTFKVVYQQGSATLRVLEADRAVTRVRVTGNYAATPSLPFATFRSMFVAMANDDVDHVSWNGAAGGTSGDEPILSFSATAATQYLFARDVRSEHNTSAPDIWIGDFGQ
jgi:hypothetical protein